MSRHGLLTVAMVGAVVAGCTVSPAASPTMTAESRPSPSASLGTTAQPTGAVVPGARHIPSSGPIEPGRYYIARGPWTPATFSFTMPAGWAAQNFGQTIGKNADVEGREVGFSVSIVDQLFAQPCGPNDTLEVGPTAEDLASALVALPGVMMLESVDITLDGRPGKRVQIIAEPGIEEADCDPPIGLQIWLDRAGNKYFVLGPGGVGPGGNPESRGWVTMVDHEAGRFVIVWGGHLTAADEDMTELTSIIESIRFEP